MEACPHNLAPTASTTAQLALGDRAKAQSDYLKALALVDVADPQHRLLTLKLIEAGGMPPHTEDKT